jgi:hypothetical protein
VDTKRNQKDRSEPDFFEIGIGDQVWKRKLALQRVIFNNNRNDFHPIKNPPDEKPREGVIDRKL